MMDNFIEEVKEEVRRDQLKQIWDDYGNYIIGLVLAVILFTLGYLFWQYRVKQRVATETTQFEKALALREAGNKKEAEAILQKMIEHASQGYKTVALLELAKLKSAQGQDAEAIYATIVKDKKIPEVYRQLASYEQMVVKFDKTNTREFVSELEPLLKEETPWFASLQELEALAYIRGGQAQTARSIFDALLNEQDTPQALRLRARAMVEQLK